MDKISKNKNKYKIAGLFIFLSASLIFLSNIILLNIQDYYLSIFGCIIALYLFFFHFYDKDEYYNKVYVYYLSTAFYLIFNIFFILKGQVSWQFPIFCGYLFFTLLVIDTCNFKFQLGQTIIFTTLGFVFFKYSSKDFTYYIQDIMSLVSVCILFFIVTKITKLPIIVFVTCVLMSNVVLLLNNDFKFCSYIFIYLTTYCFFLTRSVDKFLEYTKVNQDIINLQISLNLFLLLNLINLYTRYYFGV